MTEFQVAMREAEARTQEASQRLVQANNSGSETERQTALKQLQQVQAEQTEKLSRLAAQTQERIKALGLLKQK
jgi:hypothetical protein